MTKAKAYKTMVRMFERRSERLDEAMTQERRRLQALEQARQACEAARAACEAAQAAAADERDAVLTQAFTPESLIIMNLRVEAKVAETAQAALAVKKSVQQVDDQQTVLVTARREQRRNGQRIELFGNAHRDIVRAVEAEREENDEEEAAEGFVARMLAKRRAAAS
jgi:Bacterial type III secretion protein (HrpB7)